MEQGTLIHRTALYAPISLSLPYLYSHRSRNVASPHLTDHIEAALIQLSRSANSTHIYTITYTKYI